LSIIYECAEEGASYADMVEKVKMICKICGSRVYYEIKNSCPTCGLIVIYCKNCGYDYVFGE